MKQDTCFHIANFKVNVQLHFMAAFYLVLLTGCTHYYYVPPAQNVPLFREKNEVRLSANYSEDVGHGFDLHAAYAVTNRFAIMSNFSSVKDELDDEYGKGNYFDVAIGYYKPIYANMVFEIYGGMGSSNQNHTYGSYSGGVPGSTADLSFVNFFLQPAIGYTSNGLDVAVTTRFSHLTFHSIKNNTMQFTVEQEKLNMISTNKNSLLFEPSLTVRGGWKYMKAQLQLLLSENLTNSKLEFYNYRTSVGLSFAFADRFKKKRS